MGETNLFSGSQHHQQAVLLVGHSHLGVFGVHRARIHVEPNAPEFVLKTIAEGPRRIEGLSCLIPPAAHLHDGLRQFSAGKIVVMLWKGGFHQSKFIIVEQPCFDFILSDEPDSAVLDSARLVPESMVEAVLRPSAKDLRNAIMAIKNFEFSAPDRIIVAETPPPKGELDFVLRRVEREFGTEVSSKLRDPVSGFAVIEPTIMRKIWKLLMRVNREVTTELGAEFLPVPPACQDENGFLKPEYYSDDVSHANPAWGDLFLENLCGYLDRGDC